MKFFSSKWTGVLGIFIAVGCLPGVASGTFPGPLPQVAPFNANGSANNVSPIPNGFDPLFIDRAQVRFSGRFIPAGLLVGRTIRSLARCNVRINAVLNEPPAFGGFGELVLGAQDTLLFPTRVSNEQIKFETLAGQSPSYQLEIKSRGPATPNGRLIAPGLPLEFRLKVDRASIKGPDAAGAAALCPPGFVHNIQVPVDFLDTDFTIDCTVDGPGNLLTVTTFLLAPPMKPPCWKRLPDVPDDKLRTPY